MLKGVRISRGVALGRLYLYAPFVPQVEQGPCMPGGEEAQRQAYRRAKEGLGQRGCVAWRRPYRRAATERNFSSASEILDDVVMEEEILDAITQREPRPVKRWTGCTAPMQKPWPVPEPVIRERARDLDDVRGRILRNLQGVPEKNLAGLTQPCIVAAEELLPSQIAQMNPAVVQGLAAQKGAPRAMLPL